MSAAIESGQNRRPKSRPETVQKREAIIHAAMDIFGSRGYAKTSLAEIAEKVGMTHSGVLHHFGSKQNLFLEAVDYRDLADLAALGRTDMPSGRAQFEHLIDTAFRNSERMAVVQAFVVLSTEALTGDSPVLDHFQARYQRLRTDIPENFRQLCAEEGVTEQDSIEHAAASILAVMDGLQYQWLLEQNEVQLGEATRFAIHAIVDAALGPNPSPSAGTSPAE